jgi:CrcB protein
VVRFLLICLGGATGTAARYLLSGWTQHEIGSPFPFGTLSVNVIGSFAMSMIMYVGVARGLLRPDLSMILTTGVLGGFTTYSSFNYDIIRLVAGGAVGLGLLYAASTFVGCMLAGVGGLFLARLVAGT